MSSLAVPHPSRQPVDWKAVDKVVFDWATESLGGLDAIWENQNVPQPPYPYLSLFRQGEVDEGGIDEKRQRTLADDGSIMPIGSTKTPSVNEEVTYQPITFTVTIQAYVDFNAGANDPSCNAVQLLGKLKRTLGLTTTVDGFRAAGLSIVRPEAVQDNSVMANGEWLSRATLDVIFRTASVMTKQVGFIDKVHLQSTQFGVDTIVDAS